jgi:EPS-associated MarR family transcriptional regulator
MTSRQSLLQQDTYFRVLRLLQENPNLSQRELAQRIGVSVGGLNYCLKALIEKGLVKAHNFSRSKQKLGYAYILTPHGLIEKARLTSSFLGRKMKEFDALRAEIETLKIEADCHRQLDWGNSLDLNDQQSRSVTLNYLRRCTDPGAGAQGPERK